MWEVVTARRRLRLLGKVATLPCAPGQPGTWVYEGAPAGVVSNPTPRGRAGVLQGSQEGWAVRLEKGDQEGLEVVRSPTL